MWKEIDFEIRGRESLGASVTSQRLEPLVVRIRLALHKHRLPDGSVVNRLKPRDQDHLQPFPLASILQRSLVANGRIGYYPGEPPISCPCRSHNKQRRR
jgi:hypothetical protein